MRGRLALGLLVALAIVEWSAACGLISRRRVVNQEGNAVYRKEIYGRSPSDQLLKAKDLAVGGQFEEALEICRRIIRDHPGDEAAPEAQFLIGDISYSHLYHRHDDRRALVEFRLFLDLYPTHPLAPRAAERVAELEARLRGGR